MGESILNRSGIPVSGGTITGSLKFMRGGRTDEPLKVHYHSSSGNNIVIGAGGLTVIGGGESADNLYTALDPDSLDIFNIEQLHLASDTTISIHTNCQTIGSRKTIVIDRNGNIAAPGGFSGNASSATKLATARKIGNANFDGTAAISLAQIGAAAVSHTHDIVAMGGGRIISGSYTGDGATPNGTENGVSNPRFINLGVTPKAVLVLIRGTKVSYNEGHEYCSGGLATTGSPSIGREGNYVLSIVTNGFNVYKESKGSNWLSFSQTNEKDVIYNYIALI